MRFARIKNKFQIQLSKYINIKNFLKFIIPILLAIFLVGALGIYSVVASYNARIIKDDTHIPEELFNVTIVLKISDLSNASGFWNDALQKSLDLYNSRKVKDIYIFIINDSNQVNFDITKINKYFKTLPESRYKVANLANTVYDVCNSLNEDFKVTKTLLITYQSYNPRIGFLCNSQNIFTAGLFVKTDYVDSIINVEDVISDILYVSFPNQ
ncbi:MAG: hypothetical protein ABI721_03710 [Candidatus Dojkabacteria bacterium]